MSDIRLTDRECRMFRLIRRSLRICVLVGLSLAAILFGACGLWMSTAGAPAGLNHLGGWTVSRTSRSVCLAARLSECDGYLIAVSSHRDRADLVTSFATSAPELKAPGFLDFRIGPVLVWYLSVEFPEAASARCSTRMKWTLLDLTSPPWLSTPLFALYPVFAFVRGPLRRRRRRARGCCVRCGYDLTGNVSGTCPECGARVKGHARADTGER